MKTKFVNNVYICFVLEKGKFFEHEFLIVVHYDLAETDDICIYLSVLVFSMLSKQSKVKVQILNSNFSEINE